MKTIVKNFYKLSFAAIVACLCCAMDAGAAAVRQSPTYANTKMNRTGTRAPVTTSVSTPTVTETPVVEEPATVEPEPEPIIVVDNKTSKFDAVFEDLGTDTAENSASDLAERVRRQRALLDGSANAGVGGETSSGITGANACDSTLRKCMAEKCGNDFTKCSKDSTAIWGDKMDSCRRKTKCTGHEYAVFAPEILADRDLNERMSYYQSVLTCGNKYNSCVFNACGSKLEKCLSKSDGDSAISKCESIARECKEQDSGLAARVMSVFGDLRTVATAQAKKDEERLYELRDLMRTQCNRLGAMFDERTLDCVYTVNFFAGDDNSTPKASKKLYAGDTFQCNANWFGVDVTTFKENAYRRTRAQTSASSAMLGAGVGVAAGLLSSGAIGRALDTQKAEKEAKQECEDSGFTWEKGACNQEKPLEKPNKNDKSELTDDESDDIDDDDIETDDTPKGSASTDLNSILNNSGVTAIANDAVTCLQYKSESECAKHSDKCYWETSKKPNGCWALSSQQSGTSATEQPEQNNEVVPPANTPQNSGSCNLNFSELAQNLVIDKPIDLSGCSATQIAQNKGVLEAACNGNNTTLVLRKNNKTVSEHQVEPVTENTSFTCKFKRWFDITDVNGKIAEIEKWDSETQPTQQDCASTCAKIKSITDPAKNIVVFPDNKQCLKVCVPEVKKSCDGLVGKPFGRSIISDIAVIKYKMDGNKLTYQCQFHYQNVTDDIMNDAMAKINQTSHTGLSYSGAGSEGSGNQTSNSSSKLNPNVNGTDMHYILISQKFDNLSSIEKQAWPLVWGKRPGEWFVNFPDNVSVWGLSACSSLAGSKKNAVATNQDRVLKAYQAASEPTTSPEGRYCYCKSYSAPNRSKWIYVDDTTSNKDCANQCPVSCAYALMKNTDFRKAVVNNPDNSTSTTTTNNNNNNQGNNTKNNTSTQTGKLNPNVNGTESRYIGINQTYYDLSSEQRQGWPVAWGRKPGEWFVNFPDNVSIRGFSACSSLAGSKKGAVASNQDRVLKAYQAASEPTTSPEGQYCYCKSYSAPNRSKWIYFDDEGSNRQCSYTCPMHCARELKNYSDFRKAIVNNPE